MESLKLSKGSEDAFLRYKPNITKEQKNPKNMFMLGYQAAIIEQDKELEALQHHRDSTVGLFATDKTPKIIADAIINQLNDVFNLNLYTVDSFDMSQHVENYLNGLFFKIK